jgi:hypothetical protein
MGDTKGGAFDISEEQALKMLRAPNPHGRPNSDVIVPWVNGPMSRADRVTCSSLILEASVPKQIARNMKDHFFIYFCE